MLEALPGVHDVTPKSTQTANYTYYVLHFEQPVDHDDPASGTFLQEVSLLHRNINAPMVAWTSGYWDYYEDRTVELKLPGGVLTFTGEDYLFGFALPNFFFHVVTAYDILRHKGVQIGKLDYLGPVGG